MATKTNITNPKAKPNIGSSIDNRDVPELVILFHLMSKNNLVVYNYILLF